MKKISVLIKTSCLFIVLVLGFSSNLLAKKTGYKIVAHVLNCQDTVLQFCNYYGRPGQVNIIKTIKKKKGNNLDFTFESDSSIIGGLYMLLFKNKSSQFEFLLQNGDQLEVTYDFNKPNETAVVIGTEEEKNYMAYLKYMLPFNDKFKQCDQEMKSAKTKKDSMACKEKRKALTDQINAYRKNYSQKYPSGLLTKFFKSNEEIDFPSDIKGNEEKEKEYVRHHIWDHFDFSDDRLVYTPFIEPKLGTYLSLSPQNADTINYISDLLLKKMEASKEQYKFTLDWLVRAQEHAKVQFGDDCFIYLVENYYLKGKATWAKDSVIKSYQKKISLLASNVIGSKASEINVLDDKDQPLSAASIYPKHEYSVLFFYSPTCNHCTDELPKLDSAIASLKRDIVIVGIDANGESEKFKELIAKTTYKSNWIHMHDPKKSSDYRQKYAVYTTPVLYLVDRKGIIVGKRFDHETIQTLIESLDHRTKK